MITKFRFWFRRLAGPRFLNLIVEWAGNLLWILFAVVRYEDRFKSRLNMLGFEPAKKVVVNPRFVLTDRSFLMPGYSGVTNWIEKLSTSLDDVPHSILCQSFHPFKTRIWIRHHTSIVLLPVFKSAISTGRLSRYLAWSKTVSRHVEKMPKDTIVIGSISGLETYAMRNRANTFTLLVTDHRRNQYPNLSIGQLNSPDLIDFRSRLISKHEKQILDSQSMRFLADSNSIIQDFETLFQVKVQSKSCVTYIPASDDNCNINKKNNEILFVGRCDVRKNLAPLLDAWQLLNRHLKGWRLVIATSGGDDGVAANKLNSIRKNQNIEVFWNISEQAKHRLFSRAKIVVVPSKYESFGLVALEAMQHHCYVIANKVGGLQEIVPEDFGMTIDMNDLSLALALFRVTELVNSSSHKIDIDSLNLYLNEFTFQKTRNVLLNLVS